jgi:hypothetical protein
MGHAAVAGREVKEGGGRCAERGAEKRHAGQEGLAAAAWGFYSTDLGFTRGAGRTAGWAPVHERRDAPARRRPGCDVLSLSRAGPSLGECVRGGGVLVGQGPPGAVACEPRAAAVVLLCDGTERSEERRMQACDGREESREGGT